MQIGHASEHRLINNHEPYAWRVEEDAMVDVLMEAVWRHHVSRRMKLKFFMLNLLMNVGLLVRRS